MNRVRLLAVLALGGAVLATVSATVRAQGVPATQGALGAQGAQSAQGGRGGQGAVRPDSGQARPARQGRRAIDIRATAPAPEVVTIRPREIPEFPRVLPLPDGLPAVRVPSDREPVTVVIFPGGPVPVPPPPATRPESTRPPHE